MECSIKRGEVSRHFLAVKVMLFFFSSGIVALCRAEEGSGGTAPPAAPSLTLLWVILLQKGGQAGLWGGPLGWVLFKGFAQALLLCPHPPTPTPLPRRPRPPLGSDPICLWDGGTAASLCP